MRKATGTAVLGAVLCALLLAGCHARGTAAGQPAGVVATATTTGGAAAGGGGASSAGAADAGTTGGTPAPDSSIDANLNSVNQDLGGLDSELAKATQSPPDGD